MNALYFLKSFMTIVFLVVSSFLCIGQDQPKAVDIQLQFSDKDSVKSVTALLHEMVNKELQQVVKNTSVHFYVQRTFSLLPFGEEGLKTDSTGEVTAQFPSDIPGDSAGNVTIVVKLEDVDAYANTEVRKTVKWGIPVIYDDKVEKRSLWATSANAPISYLLLITSLVAAAWGLIFYIILRLHRISRT